MLASSLPARWRERATDLRGFAAEGAASAFEASAAELEQALVGEAGGPEVAVLRSDVQEAGWRERLWDVDADVRLGVREAAEALGRPRSFVYSHTKGHEAIPHRRQDGRLVFVAGELRQWIRDREDVVASPPTLRVS